MKRYATDSSERVLVNSAGNPLVAEGRKADSIGKAMQTLRNNMDRVAPVTFKRFRSTVATVLAGQYPEFEDLFLGHAPKTTAQRHYVKPNQDRFNEAVAWLRPNSYALIETATPATSENPNQKGGVKA